jgi:zinc transporter 1
MTSSPVSKAAQQLDPQSHFSLIDGSMCQGLPEDLQHHDGDHDHDHDHDEVPKVTWRLITMIVLTGTVFLAELITGQITKSLSLQSDAWHMLSDEIALIIGFIAHTLSKKPPTPTMTFGWARTEVLGGLINATFMLAICLMIALDAIERFIDPPQIQKPLLFLIVGGIGLVANVIGLLMFRDHNHSDNIRGVFLHVFGDFLGSIGVIVTALIYYFSDWKWKIYIDPIFSILIVLMLVKGSVDLFKKTSMTVAERCPDSIDSTEIEEELCRIEGVVAVHELHIWELSKSGYLAMIHIVIESQSLAKAILERVHNMIMRRRIYSVTVQMELSGDFPDSVDHLKHCVYASSFGRAKRVFSTPPVYRHTIGCPHVNFPGIESTENSDSHNHDQDDDHGRRAADWRGADETVEP